MSNDIAISVEGLGKRYRIGAAEQQPQDLWGAAKNLATSPFDHQRRMRRPLTVNSQGPPT